MVSKTNSSIRRLVASLNIHCNNSLNSEAQKQKETEIKKLQTEVVSSMIFVIYWDTFFFNRHQFSLNNQSKQAIENLVV